MNPQQPREENKPEEPIVVKDRRRVDPETGQVRPEAADQPTEQTVEPPAAAPGEPGAAPTEGAGTTPAPGGGELSEVESLRKQLDERTADVKRVQAEYANYRKRVDRDRDAVVAEAKASLVNELLPLLDDLERADQHGDLTGPFKAVADKLVAALEKAGLESYGQQNEPFDPAVHEAVQHDTSPEVDGPTVTTVLRRGYQLGDRVLRPAMVAVTDHEPAEPVGAPEDVAAATPGEPAPVVADDTTGEIPVPDPESGDQPASWFEPSEAAGGTDQSNNQK